MLQQKILVFLIGSLGDTLVGVPALWTLRENFPDAHITMLTDKQSGQVLVQGNDILDGSGLIDDYIFYPAGKPMAMAHLLLILRSRKFDSLAYLIRAYLDESRIQRDKLFFGLVGIKRYIGMQGFINNPKNSLNRSMTTVHNVADSTLARLRADGLNTPLEGQGRVDVNIGIRERENIKLWSSKLPNDGGRPWIAIGPGSKMPCKIWPFERYLIVIKNLVSEFNVWPLIFGGSSEQKLGMKLIKELGCGFVPAGTLGVRDSIAAMEKCLLYLGNDTGTMHMAASSGLRCVVPFSSRDIPGLWYPYGKGHIILRTPIPCEGCMLEDCIDRKMECILTISVQQVTDACRSILSNLINQKSKGSLTKE